MAGRILTAVIAGSLHRGTAWLLASPVATQYALAGRNDDAFTMLERAFALGYPGRHALANDPDFAGLRADPRAKQLTSTR